MSGLHPIRLGLGGPRLSPSHGGAAPSGVLGARYNGGLELHDGSGHLPRDAGGFYLSRSTGDRLLIDDGWSEGDAIGAPKVYGLLTAVVMGTPATARRSGFDALSDANYVIASASTNKVSIVTKTRIPTSTACQLADSLVTSPRFTHYAMGRRPATAAVGPASSTTAVTALPALAAGTAVYTTGRYDDVTGESGAGVYLQSDGSEYSYVAGAPAAGINFAGPLYLGRRATAGGAWDKTVSCAVVWDGNSKSQSALAAVVAAIHAGATIDAIQVAYSPQMATDGVVCGAYDSEALTDLFALSGAGDAVTAEYP